MFCGSSSRCCALVCSMWLWYSWSYSLTILLIIILKKVRTRPCHNKGQRSHYRKRRENECEFPPRLHFFFIFYAKFILKLSPFIFEKMLDFSVFNLNSVRQVKYIFLFDLIFRSQSIYFSHVRIGFPYLNQCYAVNKVSCLRTRHTDSDKQNSCSDS